MKDKLLRLIVTGRAKEAELFVPLVDDLPPSEPGRWTAKDQVAHMMSWREIAVLELDAVRTGGAAPVVDDDDDVTNAGFYADTHQLPAKAILESAASSWNSLEEAVTACTEDMLMAPRPGFPHLKAWKTVPEKAVDHLSDHLQYWYAEHGDAAAEDRAAMWRYEVNTAAFPEDRRVAVEEFALGQFFARRGRPEEARPHLQAALALRPDLRGFLD